MASFETLARDVDADLEREHVVADDVRLHVVTAGPEDGDVVVLLHGFPEFWYSWREQIPALADAGYRVVVPDMRGYNESEKPRGVDQYRIDRLVADVAALVEHYASDDGESPGDDGADADRDGDGADADRDGDGADADPETARAHVVGHDWGGGVAWATAIRRPDVVDRLGVLNAPHPERFRELLRTPAQLKRSWYMFYFQLPRLPEYGLTRKDAALLEDVFADAMPERELRHYRQALLRPGAASAALNYYRSSVREGIRDQLPFVSASIPMPDGVVDAPTVVAWGERDEALVPANLDGLDRWVSDLRVERIPDAGHWVQLDAPERASDELLAHFEPESA
ncbi:alpha/beta fold hydrolase [Halorubellus sp. JP-L1]|uniref:alpha/beta fold hydrolase n=1 Tax=Halorubellus sp. JP-L1 TaxID=2715753 RepID=UPI00140D24A7|nr:alpha/beta fold hydrolase [Halorubellus sp. JP-L1]NHN41530.1 alpha/beta fold hydrolase [Halorubellus sp. JP-L1]